MTVEQSEFIDLAKIAIDKAGHYKNIGHSDRMRLLAICYDWIKVENFDSLTYGKNRRNKHRIICNIIDNLMITIKYNEIRDRNNEFFKWLGKKLNIKA